MHTTWTGFRRKRYVICPPSPHPFDDERINFSSATEASCRHFIPSYHFVWSRNTTRIPSARSLVCICWLAKQWIRWRKRLTLTNLMRRAGCLSWCLASSSSRASRSVSHIRARSDTVRRSFLFNFPLFQGWHLVYPFHEPLHG